ncbi:imidazole glycerol phosphate synthase subunit HisF, partial [Candidatus Gottesmanbacteria bacterium]|nr:imidazole glycerol phosphate synthase subunit HisF [Candidatus Gottesmanbacteria bacterium]
TSIDSDGTKKGFAVTLTRRISESISVPVIASGGAGALSDFAQVLTRGEADAALAASLFHFKEVTISDVKNYLMKKNIPIRI